MVWHWLLIHFPREGTFKPFWYIDAIKAESKAEALRLARENWEDADVIKYLKTGVRYG